MPGVAYQKSDASVADYQIYFREGCRFGLRGPRVLDHLLDNFGLALGSAATFGRFVQQPYALQLTAIGRPTANFGLAGARPSMFLGILGIRSLLERAAFTVLEVVSARGYPTKFYQPHPYLQNMGRYIGPNAAAPREHDLFVDNVWQQAFADYGAEALADDVRSSRQSYVTEMCDIIRLVRGSLLILWFNQKPMPTGTDPEPINSFDNWMFPHLVDAASLSAICAFAREHLGDRFRLVDASTKAGLPSKLLDRTTGQPVNILDKMAAPSSNHYYPSQAGHDYAATRLCSALRELGV